MNDLVTGTIVAAPAGDVDTVQVATSLGVVSARVTDQVREFVEPGCPVTLVRRGSAGFDTLASFGTSDRATLGDELLPNPGFEALDPVTGFPIQWDASGGLGTAPWHTQMTEALRGEISVVASTVGAENADALIFSDVIPIESGKPYRVSVLVRLTPSGSAVPPVRLHFVCAESPEGTYAFGPAQWRVDETTTSGVEVELAGEVTASAAATSARFMVHITAATDSPVTVQIDSASVRRRIS